MPRITEDQLNTILQQGKVTIETVLPPHIPVQDPKPEQAVRDGPLRKARGKKEVPEVVHIRITSSRKRLIDIDNLYGGAKYPIDAIRYVGLIEDDSPTKTTLEVIQKKSEIDETTIELFKT